MKHLGSVLKCIVGGSILLSQTCILLFVFLTMLGWTVLKGAWRRKSSINCFRKELKRQDLPEELVRRMTERYGKTVDWFEVLKKH
ncbi:MAG: hypothetical protein ACK4I8_01530 [Armatimonadota bacterium]